MKEPEPEERQVPKRSANVLFRMFYYISGAKSLLAHPVYNLHAFVIHSVSSITLIFFFFTTAWEETLRLRDLLGKLLLISLLRQCPEHLDNV